jgi:anti-sigma regulatory factor (Ser/Thr protein kinase)
MSFTPSTKNVSLTFEIDDRAPALVRNFVGELLADHPRQPDILVAVSELVTNVVRHANTGQASASVKTRNGTVRIGVTQRGKPFTRPPVVATAPGGRGLVIVESIADDWGVDIDGDMLEVWFIMEGG